MAHRALLALALGIVGLLTAAPGFALAASTFADASRPDDLGDCLTPATACKTINGAIAKTGAGATVNVEPGTYAENVVVSNGISIVAVSGTPTLSPTTGVALKVTGGPAGTIQGLTFSSNVANRAQLELADDAGSTVVTGNTFVDPTPTADNQTGVSTTSQGAPQIVGNVFTNLMQGVEVLSPLAGLPGVPVIGVNTFSGAHNNGNGIQIVGTSSAALTGPTTAEVIGNAITATATPTNQQTGITIIDGGSFSLDDTVPGTGATLARNRIIGGETGIQVVGNRTPVTLDGDVIARTAFTALQESTGVVDPITGGLGGDVSMSNVDIVNNANLGAELGQGVHLAIDSSIVRDVLLVDPMQAGNPDPTATCTITFSNGPSAAGECATFQSNAVPVFANAGADDYHLAAPPSNPELIDHGNSSPPPPGAIDPDRNPRAIDAVGLCPLTPIRDIGADEFNPGIPSCPSPSGGGPGTIAGPTGQRAAALKKCKRKHGKARKRCKRRAKKLPV